jgi:AcrR family transcriptional regulator
MFGSVTTDGTVDRRRARSGDVEHLLVEAALHLLEEEGPEGVSVRRVAAAAGVAPMGVYNHFEGKNGLIDAVFRLGFTTLTEEMADLASGAEPGGADPLDVLREGFRRYRALALEHPRTYELMFLRSVPGYEPSEESKQVATESFATYVRTVDRAMQLGVLVGDDAGSLAQVMWAACHGAVALEIAGICLVADMGDVYDDLVDGLLRGFSPQGRGGSAAPGARRARAR